MKAMNDPRPLKATAALVALGYCSMLLHKSRQSNNESLKQEAMLSETNATVTNVIMESVTETAKVTSTEDDLSYTNITLDDIVITVKTTKFHKDTRLPIVLKTWFQLAKNQTWFFTDEDDEGLQNQTNGHMINTNCPSGHDREDLCCKTGAEFNFYYSTFKKWFCHFDDDNYVNVPRLLEVLQKCNYRKSWYLGKNSINVPRPVHFQKKRGYDKKYFMFGTGGAGYCISRNLAKRMQRFARGSRFVTECKTAKSPDDITMGFVIDARLGTKLTILDEFHSHLEALDLLPVESLKNQISLSYGPDIANQTRNVVNVTGFDIEYDPTRFLSLHCLLFHETDFCAKMPKYKW